MSNIYLDRIQNNKDELLKYGGVNNYLRYNFPKVNINDIKNHYVKNNLFKKASDALNSFSLLVNVENESLEKNIRFLYKELSNFNQIFKDDEHMTKHVNDVVTQNIINDLKDNNEFKLYSNVIIDMINKKEANINFDELVKNVFVRSRNLDNHMVKEKLDAIDDIIENLISVGPIKSNNTISMAINSLTPLAIFDDSYDDYVVEKYINAMVSFTKNNQFSDSNNINSLKVFLNKLDEVSTIKNATITKQHENKEVKDLIISKAVEMLNENKYFDDLGSNPIKQNIINDIRSDNELKNTVTVFLKEVDKLNLNQENKIEITEKSENQNSKPKFRM